MRCNSPPQRVDLFSGCSQHISDDAFADLIDSSKAPILAAQAECGERITHFELITALAIRHFANLQLDWVVMEAGLGGVMDATNVFDSRTVCAPIDATGVRTLSGPALVFCVGRQVSDVI